MFAWICEISMLMRGVNDHHHDEIKNSLNLAYKFYHGNCRDLCCIPVLLTVTTTTIHSLGADDDDDPDEVDYRKIYKTIMCPLKEQCSRVKMQRWPSSSLKSTTKFGKDCPYAHHPMELQFP